MHEITSRHHSVLLAWRKWLKDPAQQRADGVVLIEGEHAIISGIERGFELQTLLVDAALVKKGVALPLGCPSDVLYACPSALLEAASSLQHVEGRAMLAVFRYPCSSGEPTLADDLVILDRLQDPGNVGNILRSCAAFGVKWVVAMRGTVSLWGSKTLRAAQGAHFSLHLVEQVDIDLVAEWQRRLYQQAPLLLADAKGRAAYDSDMRSPQIVVVGNEGEGIDNRFRHLPHRSVAVPMPGGIESLNVAVSLAVLLYEQQRQRYVDQTANLGSCIGTSSKSS